MLSFLLGKHFSVGHLTDVPDRQTHASPFNFITKGLCAQEPWEVRGQLWRLFSLPPGVGLGIEHRLSPEKQVYPVVVGVFTVVQLSTLLSNHYLRGVLSILLNPKKSRRHQQLHGMSRAPGSGKHCVWVPLCCCLVAGITQLRLRFSRRLLRSVRSGPPSSSHWLNGAGP